MRFFDPFWKLKRLLNIGHEATLKKSAKVIDEFIYRVIHSRRSEIQDSRAFHKSDQLKPDLLSRFIELGEDPANQINEKTLRDIVLNFIIAGRDTTAATLSWFIYMMALHPDIAERVLEELKQFEQSLELGSLKNSIGADQQSFNELLAKFAERLDYETLARLTYLHATLTETLRLYPAVPEDPKGILADDITPDGTRLKRGDSVAYVPYCMGRMEFIWGQDADQFRPERWLKDGTFQAVSPFKFTAFQAGPRICLGKDSAYLQMKMTAALLCRFFRFKLVPGHQVKYQMSTILAMARGLKPKKTKAGEDLDCPPNFLSHIQRAKEERMRIQLKDSLPPMSKDYKIFTWLLDPMWTFTYRVVCSNVSKLIEEVPKHEYTLAIADIPYGFRMPGSINDLKPFSYPQIMKLVIDFAALTTSSLWRCVIFHSMAQSSSVTLVWYVILITYCEILI
ncbi:hypothetical protein O6H91_23G046600 [Diphasiastrum complanatum]|uniref:Uncharacterized protein n=1 Tax=Diphasiastrum complanatum TaxID=34168 RepID=A0ACC2AAA8_DIPCM|nr:hypothetical protein O6H91_23G046600 [Diphasiastrum complanatum]